MLENQPEVEPNQEKHQRWYEENVEREEPTQGGPADCVARQDEVGQAPPHDGHPAGLCRGDDGRPDRGLIPAQQLSGKGEGEGEQEKQRAGEPVELAGKLVRAHHVHPRDMDADQYHHGRGPEVVQAPEKAAHQGLLGDESQAFVCIAGRGDVGGGEGDARHYLEHEGDEGGAAEDVPPAGSPGDRVLERMARPGHQTAAVVQPAEKFSDHARLTLAGWGS